MYLYAVTLPLCDVNLPCVCKCKHATSALHPCILCKTLIFFRISFFFELMSQIPRHYQICLAVCSWISTYIHINKLELMISVRFVKWKWNYCRFADIEMLISESMVSFLIYYYPHVYKHTLQGEIYLFLQSAQIIFNPFGRKFILKFLVTFIFLDHFLFINVQSV